VPVAPIPLGRKYEPPVRGSALRPRRRSGWSGDRVGMAQMIVAFLGTAAWVGGVLVLVVMAVLPLLEHFADAERR
jgi:hypothetical protein